MANLTIPIDDQVLKQARLRAVEQGTSVNALLRDHLEAYAGASRARRQAVSELLDTSTKAVSRRGDGRWTRDELHAR